MCTDMIVVWLGEWRHAIRRRRGEGEKRKVGDIAPSLLLQQHAYTKNCTQVE